MSTALITRLKRLWDELWDFIGQALGETYESDYRNHS